MTRKIMAVIISAALAGRPGLAWSQNLKGLGSGSGVSLEDRSGGANPVWQLYPQSGVFRISTGTTPSDILSIIGTTGGSAGYVGIGTTAPLAQLNVVGDIRVTGATGATIGFGSSQNGVKWDSANGPFLDSTANAVINLDSNNNDADIRYFAIQKNVTTFTGGAELLRLTEGGSLGVGSTAPYSTMTVVGALGLSGIGEPSGPAADRGILYYDSNTDTIRVNLNNGGWTTLDTSAADDVANPMTAKLNLNASGADLGTTTQEAVTIDTHVIVSAGSVGLGTTAPLQRLHVSGGDMQLDNNRYLRFRNAAGNGDGAWILTSGNDMEWRDPADGQAKFAITDGGNVGIGTTVPGTLLTVAGDVRSTGATGATIGFGSSQNGVKWDSANGPFLDSTANAVINLDSDNNDADIRYFAIQKNVTTFTGGTELLRLTEAGNLGLGATPNRKFEIVGSTGAAGTELILAELRSTNTATNSAVSLRLSNTDAAGNADGTVELASIRTNQTFGGDSDAVLRTTYNNGVVYERMRVQADGKVGIGTSAPADALHIKKDYAGAPYSQLQIEPVSDAQGTGIAMKTTLTGTDRQWLLVAGTGGGSPNTNFRVYDNTAAQDRIVIDSAGNVGIGTTVPSYILDVRTDGSVQVKRISGVSSGAMWLQHNQNGSRQWATINSVSMPLAINEAGNKTGVGGTNDPATVLDVTGDAQFGNATTKSTFTATGNLQMVKGSTITSNGTISISTAASASLTGVPAIHINARGDVGVGTTASRARLEVAGNLLADGAWIQIASATLSAVASYTFSGLNGDVQKTYRVVVQGYLTAGAAVNRCAFLRPNGTATAVYTGMGHRMGIASGVSWYHDVGAYNCGTDGQFNITWLPAGQSDWTTDGEFYLDTVLYAETGRRRTYDSRSVFRPAAGNNQMSYNWFGQWNDTTTNVTSLVWGLDGGTYSGAIFLYAVNR